ncbi:MAG: polysulfide reductase [Wenzhouxiangella sp.]
MNSNISLKDFLTPTWLLIIIGLAFGAYIGLYQMFIGHIIGAGQSVILTTPLIAYIVLALTSTGILLTLSYGILKNNEAIMAQSRYLLILSFAVLLGGFAALATELGSLVNFIWAFLTPNLKSPLWMISMIYTAINILLVAGIALSLMSKGARPGRVWAWISLIVGGTAALIMGAEFGMAFARPDYQGAFASVLLPTAGLMMGTGLVVAMQRDVRLAEKLSPYFRQLAALFAVLMIASVAYAWKDNNPNLIGWVNPLMVVLFFAVAIVGGMVPRIAALVGLVGGYWALHTYIITGQLLVLGPRQVWDGEIAEYSFFQIGEIGTLVLGVALAAALYNLGRIFLLGSGEPARRPARQASVAPA